MLEAYVDTWYLYIHTYHLECTCVSILSCMRLGEQVQKSRLKIMLPATTAGISEPKEMPKTTGNASGGKLKDREEATSKNSSLGE